MDSIDLSEAMILEGQRSPHNRPNIHWICGSAESAAFEGPYDLITAADSVHWMDWGVIFPRIRSALNPGKFFCVVSRWYDNSVWWDASFQAVIDAYSTNRSFTKYEIVEELRKSGHVVIKGGIKTKPMAFTQSVEHLIEAFHSRNGFSRDRMGATGDDFDREARALLNRFAVKGMLELFSVARVTWMTIN